MNTIFAVGFPRETGEIELNELLSHHGSLRTLTIIRDQQTGKSKGYAFVHMLDQTSVERVINELNGFKLGTQTLPVRHADQKPRAFSKMIDVTSSLGM